MKSVSFLRNAWRKWEQKTFSPDNDEVAPAIPQRESQKSTQQSRAKAAAASRTLTITVKHAPMDDTTATTVDGTWQPVRTFQPPSPIYDQFTQNRSDRTLVHRHNSRFGLDVTYQEGARYRGSPSSSTSTLPRSPVRASMTSSHAPTNSKSPQYILARDRAASFTSGTPSPPRTRQITPPSSPRYPKLPSFHLLPPIDLNYTPGSKYDNKSTESNSCHCGRLSQPTHQCRCPELSLMEAYGGIAVANPPGGLESPPKTVQALLDLSVDAKPRTLYQKLGSTPHLPCREPPPPPPRSESTYSGDGDVDSFPLSLFPAPPPLVVRKKIPTPLVLRPIQSTSSHSSLDSTPIGTPTTPRFGTQALSSPSQSSIASPTKKSIYSRSTSGYSPPPFSPPTAPLPCLPSPISEDRSGHQLRSVQSTSDLRDAIPFPAKHRCTASEPPDQTNYVTKRPSKQHVGITPGIDVQTQMNAPSTTTSTDAQVQWGYAY